MNFLKMFILKWSVFSSRKDVFVQKGEIPL